MLSRHICRGTCLCAHFKSCLLPPRTIRVSVSKPTSPIRVHSTRTLVTSTTNNDYFRNLHLDFGGRKNVHSSRNLQNRRTPNVSSRGKGSDVKRTTHPTQAENTREAEPTFYKRARTVEHDEDELSGNRNVLTTVQTLHVEEQPQTSQLLGGVPEAKQGTKPIFRLKDKHSLQGGIIGTRRGNRPPPEKRLPLHVSQRPGEVYGTSAKHALPPRHKPKDIALQSRASSRKIITESTESRIAPKVRKAQFQQGSGKTRTSNQMLRVTPGWDKKYNHLHAVFGYSAGDPVVLRKAFYLDYHHAQKLFHEESSPVLKAYLNNFLSETRRLRVQQLLFGSMVTSAKQTLYVLGSIGPLRDNFHIRLQCLRYLHRAYGDELHAHPVLMEQFKGEIAACQNKNNWPTGGIEPENLGFLLTQSSSEQAKILIDGHIQLCQRPSTNLVLQVCRYYATRGKFKEVQHWLSYLAQDGLRNPDRLCRDSCASILVHDTVVEGVTGPDFRYLPRLLEKGLSPTPAMHATIIDNALDAGYSNVAWDLYRFLKTSSDKLDPHVYLALLRHSFLNKDVPGVNEMMSTIHADKDLYTNDFILGYAMNMVRVICFFERRSSVPEALSHILALYDRAFNRKILTKLGISDLLNSSEEPETLPDPGAGMLSFTLWSYVLCHRELSGVTRLWSRIQSLEKEGDVQIIEVLSSDVVYNGLILFLCRREWTTLQALDILRFMLDKRHCLPTARTWGILVCGFLRHDRMLQAQRLVKMMTQHGFSLSDIDEDHIPAGYTLDDLRGRSALQERILDERRWPTETGRSSLSLAIPQTQQESSRSVEESDVWKDLVDLRAPRSNPQGKTAARNET